jgi:hypothetical protein
MFSQVRKAGTTDVSVVAYYVGGTIYAVDCIFANAANTVAGTWTSSNYNSSDKGTTTGGANDRTSQTFAFTNAAAGDFHLTAPVPAPGTSGPTSTWPRAVRRSFAR